MNQSTFRLQQGVTLIVALIMLLVMTTVGVTVTTSSTLQERMASNSRQQFVARINAEAGLREGERYLTEVLDFSAIGSTFNTADDGLYVASNLAQAGIDQVDWNVTDDSYWLANLGESQALSLDTSVVGANQPRYIIEYSGVYNQLGVGGGPVNVGNDDGPDTDRHIFRIVAIGWGDDANAVSVLQSYYISD